MKSILAVLAILGPILGTGCAPVEENKPDPLFLEFRSLILTIEPESIGLTEDKYPDPVFALVVEVANTQGSLVLGTLADGTTRLYLSNGGALIGFRQQEDVHEASRKLLARAQDLYERADKVDAFPRPRAGYAVIYFRTFDGVRAYKVRRNDLARGDHALSELYILAADVVGKVMKIGKVLEQESQRTRESQPRPKP